MDIFLMEPTFLALFGFCFYFSDCPFLKSFAGFSLDPNFFLLNCLVSIFSFYASFLNLRPLLGIIFWMFTGPLKPKTVKTAFSPKTAGNFSYSSLDMCSGFFVPFLLSPYIQFIRRSWWLQLQNISRSWSLLTLSTCYHPSLSYHSLQPGLFQQPPSPSSCYSPSQSTNCFQHNTQSDPFERIMEFPSSKSCRPPQFTQSKSQLFKMS